MQTKHVPLKVSGRDLIAEIQAMPDGVAVAIRSICEAIGLDDARQREKLKADPRFNWRHMSSVAGDGKCREMFALPAHQIAPWLYTINSNKVKKEARQALLEFQLHITQELNAVVMGEIGSKETQELKQQVAQLTEQVRQLTELVFKLMDKQSIADVVVGQEQALASVGGKLMSRARATKSIRNQYKH